MDWARIGGIILQAYCYRRYAKIQVDNIPILVYFPQRYPNNSSTHLRYWSRPDHKLGTSYTSLANYALVNPTKHRNKHTFHASSNPVVRTQRGPGASTESTTKWHTFFHTSSPLILSQSLSSYGLPISWQMTAARPSLMACPSSWRVCRRRMISG